jgi:hypothetical protein
VHIEIKEPKNNSKKGDFDDDQEPAQGGGDDEQQEQRFIERQLVDNLNEHWLTVEPTKTDFAA